MINDYILEVCDALNIQKPRVSYNTRTFATDTMMAQCDVMNNVIFIKRMNKPTPDLMFSIAHELRHLWQYKTDESYYFKDYKQADQLSIEDYNNQIAEVDANAFASIVMTDLFGLKPLYEGLTDENIKRIKTRINIILKTW